LKIYPVSDLVNSPKTDNARCIEPVRFDRDFFERQWWAMKGKAENAKIIGLSRILPEPKGTTPQRREPGPKKCEKVHIFP